MEPYDPKPWEHVEAYQPDGTAVVTIDPFKKHVCERLAEIEKKLGSDDDGWASRRHKAAHEIQQMVQWSDSGNVVMLPETAQKIIDWLTKA